MAAEALKVLGICTDDGSTDHGTSALSNSAQSLFVQLLLLMTHPRRFSCFL